MGQGKSSPVGPEENYTAPSGTRGAVSSSEDPGESASDIDDNSKQTTPRPEEESKSQLDHMSKYRMLTTLLSSKMLRMMQSLPPSAAQDEDLCGKLVDIRDQLQRVLRHQDARRAELLCQLSAFQADGMKLDDIFAALQKVGFSRLEITLAGRQLGKMHNSLKSEAQKKEMDEMHHALQKSVEVQDMMRDEMTSLRKDKRTLKRRIKMMEKECANLTVELSAIQVQAVVRGAAARFIAGAHRASRSKSMEDVAAEVRTQASTEKRTRSVMDDSERSRQKAKLQSRLDARRQRMSRSGSAASGGSVRPMSRSGDSHTSITVAPEGGHIRDVVGGNEAEGEEEEEEAEMDEDTKREIEKARLVDQGIKEFEDLYRPISSRGPRPGTASTSSSGKDKHEKRSRKHRHREKHRDGRKSHRSRRGRDRPSSRHDRPRSRRHSNASSSSGSSSRRRERERDRSQDEHAIRVRDVDDSDIAAAIDDQPDMRSVDGRSMVSDNRSVRSSGSGETHDRDRDDKSVVSIEVAPVRDFHDDDDDDDKMSLTGISRRLATDKTRFNVNQLARGIVVPSPVAASRADSKVKSPAAQMREVGHNLASMGLGITRKDGKPADDLLESLFAQCAPGRPQAAPSSSSAGNGSTDITVAPSRGIFTPQRTKRRQKANSQGAPASAMAVIAGALSGSSLAQSPKPRALQHHPHSAPAAAAEFESSDDDDDEHADEYKDPRVRRKSGKSRRRLQPLKIGGGGDDSII